MIPLGVLAGSRYVASSGGGFVFADDFNRADGTLSSPYAGMSGTLGLQIASGQATGGGGTFGGSCVTGEAFSDDQYSQVYVTDFGSTTGGCLFLYVRTTTSRLGYEFRLRQDRGEWHLHHITGANSTALTPTGTVLADGTFTKSIPQLARLEAQGTTIRAFIDGSLVATVTDAATATGAPGLGVYRADIYLDDYEAGDL